MTRPPINAAEASRSAEEVQRLIEQALEVLQLHLTVHSPQECIALHAVQSLLTQAEDALPAVLRLLRQEGA